MEDKQIISHWILKSEKDILTAKDLFQTGHYDWCLFVWHLALEKIIKANLAVRNIPIVYTHNLARLARKIHPDLSATQIKQLNEITTFNIEARYDDRKLTFYKKSTKEYTLKWSKICEEFYVTFKEDI